MKPKPFISYAREDRAAAIRLYSDLRAMGAEPWLDLVHLRAGEPWQDAIARALREATHVIILLSSNSVTKRGFVQKEVRQALDLLEEFPPSSIFVIPVRLEPIEPQHDRLRQLHWVNLFDNYPLGIRKIADSLGLSLFGRVLGRLTTRLARAVVSRARRRTALRFVGIALNDFILDNTVIAERLRAAEKEPYFFGSSVPNVAPPVCQVVTFGPGVSITAIRHVCQILESTGEWYLQLADRGVREQTVTIGAYGYGGLRVAPLNPELTAQLAHPGFTLSRFRAWNDEHGVVLNADYPLPEE